MFRNILLLIGLVPLLMACSGETPIFPLEYSPQSFKQIKNKNLAIGEFIYLPHENGKVKSNQIQNPPWNNIYFSQDISQYFSRATALELKQAGADLSEKNNWKLTAKIYELKARWRQWLFYEFEAGFRIVDTETGKEILNKKYKSKERKLQADVTSSYRLGMNFAMLDVIEQLMDDLQNIE